MRRRRSSIAVLIPALIAVWFAVWHNRNSKPDGPPPAPATQSATPATPAPTQTVEEPEPQPAPAHVRPKSLDAASTDAAGENVEASEDAASPLDDLSAEERQAVESTLAVIERGGPFAHAKDGTVFSNREGRLPRKARGYYREYTVETPGASNRGARRIVQGRGGETYYTNDHYETFVRIDEER